MSSPAIPSEFDYELSSERSRWLRLRLLWLCATSIALTVLLSAPGIFFNLLLPQGDWSRTEGVVDLVEAVVTTLLYASAFVYARRMKLRERPLLRLVFLLLIVVATVELICQRLGPSSGGSAAAAGMLILGFDHFLACLFMPWSLREASRPAAVFFAMLTSAVLFDRFRGRGDDMNLLAIPGLAALLLPGLALCWWRYSRFQNFLSLNVESARYRQLQGELASARRLHEAALPPQITDGPFRLHYVYEPMRQIGGDLLFVHRAPDRPNLPSVVLVDVTGHGIPAALTVNRLIGELERLFAEHPDAAPDFILTALNRYISLTLSRHNIYATALCLRLDTESHRLEWTNAGHPPAFVIHFDGGTGSLDSGSTLLGVLDPDDFPPPAPRSLTLATGDILVAYTDGLSEAANPDGKQLGTEGVKSLLAAHCDGHQPPAHWPQTLLQSALAYRQSPVEDDTLILTLYRT